MSDDTFLFESETWIGDNVAPEPILAEGPASSYSQAHVPDPLLKRLMGLRLLRGVPLHYLVPREELLPPESMRFFFIDPTWTDRLVDGFLAAGDLGTRDQALRLRHVHKLRERIDDALGLRVFPSDPPVPLTGLLLRSQVVRRWPGLSVRAYVMHFGQVKKLVTMRLARLAPSVLIAIFAGLPTRVDIEEPGEGARFGVEPTGSGTYRLQLRKEPTGTEEDDDTEAGNGLTDTAVDVPMRPRGVLDVTTLASRLQEVLPSSDAFGSARLSLQLQQSAYRQICAVEAHRPTPESVLKDMSSEAMAEKVAYEAAYAALREEVP